MNKRELPNLLTASRILLCIPLAIVTSMSPIFVTLYIMCGLTDMLDGFLARKLNAVTSFGAKLDSGADVVLAAVVAYKILPMLVGTLPSLAWVGVGAVVLGKCVEYFLVKKYNPHPEYSHNLFNRACGLLIFVGLLFVNKSYFNWIAYAMIVFAFVTALYQSRAAAKFATKKKVA